MLESSFNDGTSTFRKWSRIFRWYKYVLSNVFLIDLTFEGQKYHSVEQAYQVKKATIYGTEDAKRRILFTMSARAAWWIKVDDKWSEKQASWSHEGATEGEARAVSNLLPQTFELQRTGCRSGPQPNKLVCWLGEKRASQASAMSMGLVNCLRNHVRLFIGLNKPRDTCDVIIHSRH